MISLLSFWGAKIISYNFGPCQGFLAKNNKKYFVVSVATMGYNRGMDKIQILERLYVKADIIWRELGETWPQLREVGTPEILLNGRLWRTAGFAYQEDHVIELGTKFLLHSPKYRAIMYDTILPHELAHVADWLVFGPSELRCGHGEGWRIVMKSLGLRPDPYHNMDLCDTIAA